MQDEPSADFNAARVIRRQTFKGRQILLREAGRRNNDPSRAIGSGLPSCSLIACR